MEEPRTYKILFLISDTGGGHRASAKAIAAAIEDLHPNVCAISIVDLWTDHGTWPFTSFVPAYKFLSERPTYWGMLYDSTKSNVSRDMINTSGYFLCGSRFKDAILNYNPDLICSLHPLCQDIPLKVLDEIYSAGSAKSEKKPPFVTVVTDLERAHPTWFNPGVDLCFVPSNSMKKLALNEGLDIHKIRLYGLPLRKGFWKPETRSKNEMRQLLGLLPSRPTCLILGGGEGVGEIVNITTKMVQALEKIPSQHFTVIAICGKNKEAFSSLSKQLAKHINNELSADVNNDQVGSKDKDEILRAKSVFKMNEADIKPLLGKHSFIKRSNSWPSIANYPIFESLHPFTLLNLEKTTENRKRRPRKRTAHMVSYSAEAFEKFRNSTKAPDTSWISTFDFFSPQLRWTAVEKNIDGPKNNDAALGHDQGMKNSNVAVVINGFTENVEDWMAASDLLITKAGPGTIAEACTRGLPILLSSYLPGQEEGNVDFVVNGRFGCYTPSIPSLTQMAVLLLLDPDLRKRLSLKAQKAVDPSAALKIAADIIFLLKQK